MKKLLSIILSAGVLLMNVGAFAAETDNIDQLAYVEEPDVYAVEADNVDDAAYVEEPTAFEGDADVDLLAGVQGITFEYDYAKSTELERIVKVKYDRSYFTKGINSFKAVINIPDSIVESVSFTTKLPSNFNIADSYIGSVYTCATENVDGATDKIPSDGLLFTMKLTLKQNILDPFTISLTGDSYVGDSTGIKQYLSNGGMLPASLEIPRNINDVGDGDVDGAVNWRYANEVLTLHGNGTMKEYEPGSAPWYAYADRIKSIVFTEDRLDNIGKNAFYGLKNVRTVTLSSDIRSIGASAFEGCTALTTIEIPPDSGVGIGDYAFKGCSSLKSIDVPDGVRVIGLGAFAGCTGAASATLPFIGSQKGSGNTKDTFSYIFDGSVPSALKVVSITNETNVPESAFEGCGSIETININDEVTTIGAKAFKDCTSLKAFTIPQGVTEIADGTFRNCSSMRSVDITDNIESIGISAFNGCSSLQSIYIPPIPVVEDYTFSGCSSLTKIEIPNSVTNIGLGVLANCTKLVDIKVPFVGANTDPSATAVTDESIFGYLFGVKENNAIPPSVTKVELTGTDRSLYIPKEAFKSCGYIEDIIIDGGRSILDRAFVNCLNLRNLYIPKSISTIGESILEGCTRLETLTIPFIGTNRSDRNKPTSVLGGFFGYDQTDQAHGTLQYYDDEGNFLFYKIPTTLKNVTILNQTTIPVGAFSECDFIENVSVVTGGSMGEKAFYDCRSLKTVSLPNDLINIGDEAFAGCDELETINIPTKVKNIGSLVFYNDRALKNVTMPDSVTEIAEDVFVGTDLYGNDVQLMAKDMTITCSANSAAKKFADEHDIATIIVPSSELDIKCVGANISAHAESAGGYLVDVSDTNNFNGTVYAALYDKDNNMIAAQCAKKTEADQVEYRFDFTKEESVGYSYAKVFVWDDNQRPLADGVNGNVGDYTVK